MKRITRKLIKECYIIPPTRTPCTPGLPDLEKLVKSTIEECIKVVDECQGRRIGEIDVQFLIRDHFGIK